MRRRSTAPQPEVRSTCAILVSSFLSSGFVGVSLQTPQLNLVIAAMAMSRLFRLKSTRRVATFAMTPRAARLLSWCCFCLSEPACAWAQKSTPRMVVCSAMVSPMPRRMHSLLCAAVRQMMAIFPTFSLQPISVATSTQASRISLMTFALLAE